MSDPAPGRLIPGRGGRWLHPVLVLVAAGGALSVVLAGLLSGRDGLRLLVGVDPGWLAAGIALSLYPWFSNALRLHGWLRTMGVRDISYGAALEIVLATEVGAAITPSAAGGGYVKVGMLVARGVPAGSASALTTLGTMVDGVFFLIAVPVALTVSSGPPLPVDGMAVTVARRLPWIVTAMVAGGLLVAVATRLPWVRARWHRVRAAASDFRRVYVEVGRRGRGRLVLNLGLASIQWTCRYSALTCLVIGLGISIDPVRSAVLQWVVFTAGTLIPTPAGAGGVETAFAVVYAPSLPLATLPVVIVAWRFVTFYLLVLVAAVALLALEQARRQRRMRTRVVAVDPSASEARRK